MLVTGTRKRPLGRTIVQVAIVLALAFGVLAGAGGYWAVVRSSELSNSPYDPAVIAASRRVPRGDIIDRDGNVLTHNEKDANGELYRSYSGDEISHVVGYASPRYGRVGLELAYDAELSGLAGDPFSEALRKFGTNPYDPKDLHLSMSWDLQRAAVNALGSHHGAVVMLDPRNGEVLALASTPTYDASPPAEKDGLLVEGFRIRDGHHPETGNEQLDLTSATEVSCNIWYALTGLQTGGEQLVAYADRLGFDSPIPFDLPTAASQVTNGSGSAPGGFVDDVELANAAYGQAETFVTPFQMALVASTIANGGDLMKPRIVTSISGRNGSREIGASTMAHVLAPSDAAAINRAMVQAVEGPLGQQFTTGAKVPGVTTAGKSGTAELGGRGEPHSWFIGFAPAESPTVAIAVLVEQAGRGAEVAAPIAGRLMAQALEMQR
jgi:penicillin-binding protein A